MTRRTSARIAGVTYLLYIVIGVTQLIIDRAPGGGSISEKLAFIGSHPTSMESRAMRIMRLPSSDFHVAWLKLWSVPFR
jgi:hypothetical protein